LEEACSTEHEEALEVACLASAVKWGDAEVVLEAAKVYDIRK